MQVNLYKPHANHQSFTGIKVVSGAGDVIKNLSSRDLDRFEGLVDMARCDGFVDLILFGKGKNKLTARIAENSKLGSNIIYERSQRFWETPIDFIEKMYNKTLKAEQEGSSKFERLQKADEILNRLK